MSPVRTFLLITAIGLLSATIPFGYISAIFGSVSVLINSSVLTYLIHGTDTFSAKPTSCCGGK
jgi:hypothetical protein